MDVFAQVGLYEFRLGWSMLLCFFISIRYFSILLTHVPLLLQHNHVSLVTYHITTVRTRLHGGISLGWIRHGTFAIT
jgi:hypothetical protein